MLSFLMFLFNIGNMDILYEKLYEKVLEEKHVGWCTALQFYASFYKIYIPKMKGYIVGALKSWMFNMHVPRKSNG